MEVEITLTGSGLQFNSKVSLFQATQIMAFISKVDTTAITQESDIVTEVPVGYAPEYRTLVDNSLDAGAIYESPRSAIIQTNAKTNPQKIVAIALYLGATSDNQKLFSIDEVLSGFKKAGESTPKNIGRDFREAVAAGYIYQEEKAAYRLLSSIDNVHEEGFKKPAKKKGCDWRKKREKLVVRDELKAVRIATSMEGYPDFFKLASRSDQVLWVVEYLKQNGMDGSNRAEVIGFTNKIGGDITSKNFTASNVPNVKGSYIYIENELIRLTPKGEERLRNALADQKEGK